MKCATGKCDNGKEICCTECEGKKCIYRCKNVDKPCEHRTEQIDEYIKSLRK